MEYDDYGRQKKLTDPDAGTTEYEYNAYGELVWQKDAQGNIYTTDYDVAGRISSETGPEGTTSYSYIASGNGIEQVSVVTGPNNISKSFQYDAYGSVTQITENIEGSNFITQFEYDEYGNNIRTSYPSGFSVIRTFDNNGYLGQVKRGDNNQVIWQSEYVNAMGQVEQYLSGNGLQTNLTFDPDYNFIQEIKTDNIFDLEYIFDHTTGNLTSRKDKNRNLTETFTYDNLNRLTSAAVTGQSAMYFNFSSNGNITSKTDVGTYAYHPAKLHAVQHIDDNPGTILPDEQDITYTPFNKIETIIEGDGEMHFIYGPGCNRKKVVYSENSVQVWTKNYSGDYEKTIGNTTREVHYIVGGDGLAAVYIVENGTGHMYYVIKDHLGSIMALTDETGQIVEEHNYDPWGRLRNPADWSYNNVPAMTVLDRGFTGHEHLNAFGLINMNGRLYDPLLARMLSPDNYVQMPDYTQNFNRYTYALNNPLIYTDPSGELIFTILAAIFAPPLVPAAVQLDISWMQGGFISMANGGDFWSGAGKGFITGLMNVGLSFLNVPGMIPNGFLHAGGNVLANGITNTMYKQDFFKGAGLQALTGFGGGAYSGYHIANDMGLNPWTGGLNQQQRAIWLSYKKGNITLQDAAAKMHGADYTNAGSPRITASGLDINSRATTYSLDPNGNRIGILAAARDYSSVSSEIEFHSAGLSSGKRFLFTSYHELTHAKMFYKGDMHNYYNFLQMNYGSGLFTTNLNKVAYSQAGLKIFAERWAYGSQWGRWRIHGLRINYIDLMWESIIRRGNYSLLNTF